MSYPLYQNTIHQLGQALSHRLNTPVYYFQNPYTENKNESKWMIHDNNTIIPLSINLQTIGYLKIPSILEDDQLNEIYNIVQWTLVSLEDIFRKRSISFFNEKKYPLLIESLPSKESLKRAFDLYESSSAQSFIHFHAETFDKSVFSSDLENIFIFISDLSVLSKENQLFLSHFLRTKNQHFIVASIEDDVISAQEEKKMLPSLLECFFTFNQ